MTASTGLALLNTFKEPLFKLSKDLKTEFLQLFDNGLPEYIDNFYDKYSKTKTFIYRDEKVNFYDIFFPVCLKNNSEKIEVIDDLKKLFKNRNFITIIGSAGSGKSMLMKHIFLSTVKQSFKIPIVVELRNLTDFEGNIKEYISSILMRNQLANSQKILDRVLKEGNFIFLFDGYDEIYSSSKKKITNDLEEFVDTYSKNIFVITSRPGSNAESLQRFDNFYVQPLNMQQIEEFIHLQFKDHENINSVNRIISIIQKHENRDYRNYLTNPLLLSMFIFTFNSYPEIPKYKSKFYWNVFDTLCTKHDSFTKKGFWLHERKSNLLNDDLENILKWFSYVTLFKGKYNFEIDYLKKVLQEILLKLNLDTNIDNLIYDLTVSIAIIIQDGTDYTFPHKSLQEYFTASLIKGLTDDQKKKIYHEKFNQLEDNSTGGKINLYKLCYEMDKIYFLKLFLIPKIETILKRVKTENPDDIVNSYMKIMSPHFMISDDGSLGAYSQKIYVEDSYLSFFANDEILPSFTVLDEHVHLLSKYFKAMNKKSFAPKSIKLDTVLEKPEFKEFVEKAGIKARILEIHNNIVKQFTLLKGEVDKEKEDTQHLLDI